MLHPCPFSSYLPTQWDFYNLLSLDPSSLKGTMKVEVAYAKPESQALLTLEIPEGTTVAAAIQTSGILHWFPEIERNPLSTGIFGRPCEPDQKLKSGDRVEIYRPLIADPRTARRERSQKK